jgi:hypothetical protein
MVSPRSFLRRVVTSVLFRPDGDPEVSYRPGVWTLAHRGYSGAGRLDVWVYPDRDRALAAGAELAMGCGLDEDPEAAELFSRG